MSDLKCLRENWATLMSLCKRKYVNMHFHEQPSCHLILRKNKLNHHTTQYQDVNERWAVLVYTHFFENQR